MVHRECVSSRGTGGEAREDLVHSSGYQWIYGVCNVTLEADICLRNQLCPCCSVAELPVDLGTLLYFALLSLLYFALLSLLYFALLSLPYLTLPHWTTHAF